MSGPDLPQPIYPTPTPGAGPGGAGGAAGAPPPPGSVPPGGAEPPTWSVGPAAGGPGGQPHSSGSKVSPLVWVAVGGVLLLLLAGVAVAVAQDSDEPGDGPKPTVQGEPTTTDPNGGGDDLQARAAAVASAQFVTLSPGSTVDCLADAFAADQELLASVEASGDAVQLTSASEAEAYGALIMSCASPDDLTEEFVQGQIVQGQTDQVLLSCLSTDLSALNNAEWEGLIAASVQPSRQAEVLDAIQQSYNLC